jgi:small subunit ribosomal protein S4
MARLIAKCRLCRRERQKLFLKGGRCFSPKCPIEKNGGIPPGQHGLRSGLKPSEYNTQLREKQKVKRYYGVLEHQFNKYFIEASTEENRGEQLLRLLELRLDNVVNRMGLAPSRAMARQLIRHGHVIVNEKKVKVPSYKVKKGDKVILDKKASNLLSVQEWIERKDEKVPAWLSRKGTSGTVKKLPGREEMPQDFQESLIIEYYSR